MSFKCKIGLHSWNGCICSDCNKTRNEQHDWSQDCEVCSKCSKTRENQHDWSQDCEVCSKCGKTRENQHDWSQDCEVCSKCGKTRENQHDWSQDFEKCSICRKKKDKVTFHKNEKYPHPFSPDITVKKKIYKAISKEAAIEFLSKQKITENYYYIEIETPSDSYGIDIEGKIYDSDGKFIEIDKKITKTCLSCKNEFEAGMAACPKCGSSVTLMTGEEAFDVMHSQEKSKELNDEALLLFNQGKLNDSVDYLLKAIEANPRHEMAYSNLGYVLIELGRYEEAINILERVLAFNPTREEAHRFLAKAKANLK